MAGTRPEMRAGPQCGGRLGREVVDEMAGGVEHLRNHPQVYSGSSAAPTALATAGSVIATPPVGHPGQSVANQEFFFDTELEPTDGRRR